MWAGSSIRSAFRRRWRPIGGPAILHREPGRVERLRRVSRLFFDAATTRGWNTGTSAGFAIIPIMAGNSVFAVALSQGLFERGINVQPIIHPAVPERAARLRFFLTSEHRAEQIDETIQAIEGREVNATSMQNIPGFLRGGPATTVGAEGSMPGRRRRSWRRETLKRQCAGSSRFTTRFQGVRRSGRP